MRSGRPRPASSEDERERLRLLATLQRLLADIDALAVQTRGRSKVSPRLLEALRRTNQERIALERELWLLEDRILRDILSSVPVPPDRGTRAFDAAHGLTDPRYARKLRHARQHAAEGGVGVAQALAATAAGGAGRKAPGKRF